MSLIYLRNVFGRSWIREIVTCVNNNNNNDDDDGAGGDDHENDELWR